MRIPMKNHQRYRTKKNVIALFVTAIDNEDSK